MKFIISISLIFLMFSISCFSQEYDNLQKAKQFIEGNKFKEAVTILKNIVNNDSKNHTAYYNLGRAYFGLKNYEDASEAFEEAIDLNEKEANYHFWLGQSYAMEAQEANIISQAMLASDILEEFEKTVELDPKHIPGRIGVINFYIAAPGIMGGDIDKAKYNANELIKLEEKSGRLALARIYLKQEKMDSLKIQLNILERKYEKDKSSASLYNALGYFYLNINKIDEAIAAFEKQVQLNPESENSYDSLGDGYKAAGRIDDAIAQYKKALEINPKFKPSSENLKKLQKEK
ncbi:MAG: tetratricopeptide repeat protein [Bacteroidetes bacterium]|nr:tetratricopeptide repeat protein [Bacteroidota bacterium]MBU1116651.1 tetratricopeptide repeat protein [Bacteroidota bacterium]MBU1797498.1 tetratricopeptide repeat protein [Bacteroidota bacterium]